MTAGKLDRRVQFQRANTTDNGLEKVLQFTPFGSPVWAQKKDVSDAERWRAGEVAASITTRFLVRWSSFTASITPKDQLTSDGLSYDITGIKEGDDRRQWLEITCSARIDQ